MDQNSTFEKTFVDLLQKLKWDITDPLLVKCDICHEDGSKSKGGFILIEKEGTESSKLGPTYACNSCYHKFTCVSMEDRKKLPLNSYQKIAIKNNIGTDPEKYYEMDENKTFKENVINFKRETREIQGLGKPWKCEVAFSKKEEDNDNKSSSESIFSKKEEDNDNKSSSEPIDRAFYKSCCVCKKVIETYQIKRCSNCKMAYYCSKECQKKDWKEHKKFCNYTLLK